MCGVTLRCHMFHEEIANLKWALIRNKEPFAVAAALPTVVAFIVVAVSVVLTTTGCTLAAMRK